MTLATETLTKMGYRELTTGKWAKPIGAQLLVANGTDLCLWFRTYDNTDFGVWSRVALSLSGNEALTVQNVIAAECEALSGFQPYRGNYSFDGFLFLTNEQLADSLMG